MSTTRTHYWLSDRWCSPLEPYVFLMTPSLA
nr:MAG TPA: hypothetical protein [Bacteriophage sp.]